VTTVTTEQGVRTVQWLPGFALLAAIWGSSFLFIKVGVAELHPLYLTLGRVAAGALTLLLTLLAIRDRLPRDPRLWGHLAVVAAVGNVAPFTLFGYGEQRVSSGLAGIWNAVTPLVVLPVAVLVFRTERMTVRRTAGLLTGFLGVLVVLGVWEGVGGTELTGQLMCFAAASCYGVSVPYIRRFVTGRAESGVAISAAQLLLATAQLAIISPLLAGPPPNPAGLSSGAIASVLALGALGTGLAFVINLRNIHLIGASAASTVTYVIPVFAVAIGVIGLGEHISWYQPVGALVVLLGVAISQGFRPRAPRLPSRRPSEIVNPSHPVGGNEPSRSQAPACVTGSGRPR
jgi:drug/metabolite transporter (DMT)-like permease